MSDESDQDYDSPTFEVSRREYESPSRLLERLRWLDVSTKSAFEQLAKVIESPSAKQAATGPVLVEYVSSDLSETGTKLPPPPADELCQPLSRKLSISKVDNERMLSDFAKILEIDAKIADPPPDSLIRAAKHSIARVLLTTDYKMDYLRRPPKSVCDDESEFVEQFETHVAQGFLPIFWVLTHKATSSYAAYKLKYAVCSLLMDGHVGGIFYYNFPRSMDSWLRHAELGYAMKIAGVKTSVLPLIVANPSLRMWFITRGRKARARDHLWLDWYLDENMKPAAIRDRWDNMPDAERFAIAPTCSGKVGAEDGTKGREVVKMAIRKAKAERERAERIFFDK
jgi:hypothetical protein